ncbi:hypothetical protein [Priestia megaterium]|uniref:hypothetical protein n=1 Tax=Priestia megaterium TaxID=1404 RepID=UPI00040A2240
MRKIKIYNWFKQQSFINRLLLLIFLSSLAFTAICFEIADYKHSHFSIEQDNMISATTNILAGKNAITELESRKIYQMVQDHKNKYPTYQFLAFYQKETNKKNINRYNSTLAYKDIDKAPYIYPLYGQTKKGFLADAFYVTETLDAGEWYIVQQYNPLGGYYYQVTILLLSLSLLSLLIYLIKEGRRYIKQGVLFYKSAQ